MIRRVWAGAIGCLLLAGCASPGTPTGAAAPVAGGNFSVPVLPPLPMPSSSPPSSSAPPSPFAPVSSPAPMQSSPVDVGSETPQPLPTPVFGSEGSLPPLPPGGRTIDNSGPDSAWLAQNVIDVFAEEVAAVAQDDPHYCNVAVDGFHDGMTVWWHGSPTAAVADILLRAGHAGVHASVVPTTYELAPLQAAAGKLSDRMQQIGLDEVSVSTDCSSLDVGMVVLTPTVEAAVTALVGPGIPVKFEQTGPLNPA